MIKLYKNIRDLRTQHGWTQDELAKRMGYTDRSMIAKIETGKIDLSQSKIIEFANVFGVAPGDLMGWDDKSTPEKEYEKRMTAYALLLYKQYQQASPEIQHAVDLLLKSKQ